MRIARVFVAVVLCGCPNPPPPADPFPTPFEPPTLHPVQAALTLADETLIVGAAVDASWALQGDVTGLELFLRVQSPGAPLEGSGKGSLAPGLSPPTGDVAYLDANGAWSTTAVALGAAANGSRMVTLPVSGAGSYRLDLLVQRGTSVEAFASRQVFVSDAPAFALRVNRVVAGTGDRVHAELVLLAGKTPAPVSYVAWLRDPADRVVSLPTLRAEATPLFSGTSADGRVTLLDGPLELDGVHHLVVRQLDANGQLTALGGAEIEVCSGTAMVSGVAIADGSPVSQPSVTLISLEAPGRAGTSGGGDGHYSVEVSPGRYLAFATAFTDTGSFSSDVAAVTVSCGATAVTADLTLHQTSSMGQGLRRGGVQRQPVNTSYASDHLPTIRVAVVPTQKNEPADLPGLMADKLAYHVQQGVPYADVNLTTPSTNRALLTFVRDNMLLGSEDEDLSALAQTVGVWEFVIILHLERSGSERRMTVALTDGSSIINRFEGRYSDTTLLNLTKTFGERLQQATSKQGTRLPLLNALRTWQDLPLNPKLDIKATPERAPTGSNVAIEISLGETTPGAPPGAFREVKLDVVPGPATMTLVTDALGKAHFTWMATGVPTTFTVRFRTLSEAVEVFPASTGLLQMGAPKANVVETEKVPCTLFLQSGTGPLANKDVMLAATGATGSSTDVSMVRTNGQGQATFEFTAGRPGLAAVRATANAGQATDDQTLYFNVEALATVNVQALPFSNLVTSGNTDIVANVRVAGVSIAALPVRFTVSGGGALSSLAEVTDAAGQATTRYTAPSSLSGSATLTATVQVDGKSYSGNVTVTYAPPCATCPPQIQPTQPGVAKGGTLQFRSNEPVMWSATAGSISAGGVLTAPQTGGYLHVTATSMRSMTLTATVPVLVACNVAEMTRAWSVSLEPSPVMVGPCRIDQGATLSLAPTNANPLQMQAHLGLPLPPNPPTGLDCNRDIGLGQMQTSACALNISFRDQVTNCLNLQTNIFPDATAEGLAKIRGRWTTRTGNVACDVIDDIGWFSP